MNLFFIWILFLAFLVRTIRNSLYQVFLWQIKEYRLDRFLIHLHTWQGKRMIFGPLSLIKWVLIGSYFWGLPIFLPVVAVYVFEAVLNFKEILSSFKKPIFTFKATFVAGLVIILETLLFFWPSGQNGGLALWVLVLDKILSPTVAIIFLSLSVPTTIQRRIVIDKAKEIIKKNAKLTTIGITGSYGKTSTKEFLATILAGKFKVLKTTGSNNTDIGVAKTILDNVKDQEIFICEMAAYKRGEIKTICDIVQPKMGVITAINEQHLDLFGTLENTIRTKYELIKALPAGGLGVFNGNNKYTNNLADKARTSGLNILVYRYGRGDIVARDIRVFPRKIECIALIGKEKQKLTANLLGKQNVENILAASAVAHHLGMTLSEIAEGVKKLVPPEMTMKPYPGPTGATLIDDTFNVNPAAVLAAIEYAEIYRGKKILVLQPMIELGSESERAHQEIGEVAAKTCDLIILTNKNFNEQFLKGANKVKDGGEKVINLDNKSSAIKIKKIVDKDSVVVFEGKESARVLNQLKNL